MDGSPPSNRSIRIKDAAPQLSASSIHHHHHHHAAFLKPSSRLSMAPHFAAIPHTISPLHTVSPPPLHRELAPTPFPSSCRRLLEFTCLKRTTAPAPAIPRSAVRFCFLAFATTGQEAATSTLVLQEVDFVWKGEGTQILLTGDFLNWETKVPLTKAEDGAFYAKQKLPPGTYTYKYIVDGEWLHSPQNPTIPDGKGGFNNQIIVGADEVTPKPSNIEVKPKSLKSKPTASTPAAAATATTAKPAVKKVLQKTLPEVINEDVIPRLSDILAKEEGISNVDVLYQENQLEGSFVKNGVLYTFWAFFPDGKLEGSRGFSLSSHGAPPSTVEPFLIDEKKVTADLLVFWITKRLFAQKLLSIN